MEKFTTHTGVGVPLRRSNVDTDQIIPAVYLKRVTREGFGDGLFAAWREDPSFVLNQPRYQGATILVAGLLNVVFAAHSGLWGVLVIDMVQFFIKMTAVIAAA